MKASNPKAKTAPPPTPVSLPKTVENELELLRRIVRELAGCEWQGAHETVSGLIVEARKVSGWKRREWYV